MNAIALLRKFVQNKHGQVVIWQRPNMPLALWIFFAVLARVVADGEVHRLFAGLGSLSLVIWAMLEIIWGASPFRRLLGSLVFIMTIRTFLA